MNLTPITSPVLPAITVDAAGATGCSSADIAIRKGSEYSARSRANFLAGSMGLTVSFYTSPRSKDMVTAHANFCGPVEQARLAASRFR